MGCTSLQQLCFWFGYICFGSVSISLLYWHAERAEQSSYLVLGMVRSAKSFVRAGLHRVVVKSPSLEILKTYLDAHLHDLL